MVFRKWNIIDCRHVAATNKFQIQLNNPIRYAAAKETSSEKLKRLKKKNRLSKPDRTSTRRRHFSADNRYNQRQSPAKHSIVSSESCSLDDLPKVEQRVSYRRNEITNNTAKNSSLTVSNDTFQIQHSENIRVYKESQIKNDNNKTNSLKDEAEVENQILDNEKRKNDENRTGSNSNFDGKQNSSTVDSMKEIPNEFQDGETIGKVYPNDLTENKSKRINETTYSSNFDELNNKTEEWHDSYTTIKPKKYKPKYNFRDIFENYKFDNKTYNSKISHNNTFKYFNDKSSTGYTKENSFEILRPSIVEMNLEKSGTTYGVQTNLDSDQVKSEQSLESNGELDAWEPKRRNVAKESLVDYENYSVLHKQDLRKRNDNTATSDIKIDNATNIANIVKTVTNTTNINSLHTVVIVNSQTTPKIDPAFYYADVIGNIEHTTTEATIIHYSKPVTQHIIKKGADKDSAETLRKEIVNSGQAHFGQDMYKNTDEQMIYINENDVVADEFPEFVPVLGKIAGRS